ncbi:uncharacterized protein LOC101782778 [Setaria italica]|uniref:uncharacterized protein LOC101782778 n=1 Tax=Setaria italica TaxID=4555 RepID=UPI000BE51CCC|nr:uncharacterized protein LOC101782778 [Setaria italica]
MRKAKRGGDDLTRNFRKNRRACKNDSLVSGCFFGESNQDVWTGLGDELKSYFSKHVASITLCNGNTILFSCSGIAMQCQERHLTKFLTSASLVRVLNGTNKDHDDLNIRVRHEGNEVYKGVVAEFDLDHNFAVVDVHTFLDVQVGPFRCALESLPHGEVLVVGRGVSGEILAKSVVLNGDSRVSKDDEDLNCKISEAWEGGPFLSVDRNVVVMNLFLTMRRTVFLPWGTILKHLEFGARSVGEKSNSHPEVHGDFLDQEQLDLDFMGYPKLPSTMSRAGMNLAYTFEDTFGNKLGEGVWRKFSKRTFSTVDLNVVALASFNEEKRFFACTGFFIEWNGSMIILTSTSLVRTSSDENKIVENLRIEVLLNNQCKEGTLEHYDLHNNVPLVSVKNYPALCPLNTLVDWDMSFKVAAVERCFKSGVLMATSGDMVSWLGTLDCEFLVRSTFKISKAGIGGPPVNLDGDVISMNFYDKRIGTPFLLWEDICEILAYFETKINLVKLAMTVIALMRPVNCLETTKLS